jgi:hypothetical protein
MADTITQERLEPTREGASVMAQRSGWWTSPEESPTPPQHVVGEIQFGGRLCWALTCVDVL